MFRTIGGPVIQDVGKNIDLSCHDACYPAVIGRASTVWQGYIVTGRFGLDAMFSSACCIWRQRVINPETRQTACFGIRSVITVIDTFSAEFRIAAEFGIQDSSSSFPSIVSTLDGQTAKVG